MSSHDMLKVEYLARKYNETNIPLYLSYPTESWWKSNMDETAFQNEFSHVENPFLYFHFPYCKKPCYYCCCYKDVTSDPRDKEIYIEYIEKEFHHKLELLGGSSFNQISQIHWGGGTPTYMDCGQIERVFGTIMSKTSIDYNKESSISIEAYPDEEVLNIEKLKLLRQLGFNEISFGIQDFNERVQKVINRDCKKETVERIINTCKELGFRVHIDLCYGLPFQGLSEFEDTINYVTKMLPDRIAIFPYAHYPMIFPLQKVIPTASIPNSFIKIMLARLAQEMLTANGYMSVGTDHFVKQDNPLYRASVEGQVVRDFMGYSVGNRKNFIGFGKAAISFSGNAFFHNAKSLDKYYQKIDAKQIPLEENIGHTMSREDFIRNSVIQKSILCDFEINKNEISKKFNICFNDFFKHELESLDAYANDGLIEFVDSNIIRLTDYGKMFAKHIAYVFDSYYNKTNKNL